MIKRFFKNIQEKRDYERLYWRQIFEEKLKNDINSLGNEIKNKIQSVFEEQIKLESLNLTENITFINNDKFYDMLNVTNCNSKKQLQLVSCNYHDNKSFNVKMSQDGLNLDDKIKLKNDTPYYGEKLALHNNFLLAAALEENIPTPHLYDGNVISMTHCESGVEQSNMILGSDKLAKELLLKACDKMGSFTNENKEIIGFKPYVLIYHPSKISIVESMFCNLQTKIQPYQLSNLKNTKLMWLLGRIQNMNSPIITIKKKPEISLKNNFNIQNYNFKSGVDYDLCVDYDCSYAIPFWQSVIRIELED